MSDDLALWARSVRREFRDYVRQVGKVPSLAFYVSTRNNPRKANAWMRADIAADADVAWDRLREMAEEHGSVFAAVAGLHGFADGHAVLLCAFDGVDDEKWWADADERGVGPWREGAFRFDLGEARAALP
jgi:hypothetical protein